MSRKSLSLPQWIEEEGTWPIATLLGTHPTTVHYWRVGHVLPKPEMMLKIKRATNGRLTCDSMIEEYFENEVNKGKFRK